MQTENKKSVAFVQFDIENFHPYITIEFLYKYVSKRNYINIRRRP